MRRWLRARCLSCRPMQSTGYGICRLKLFLLTDSGQWGPKDSFFASRLGMTDVRDHETWLS